MGRKRTGHTSVRKGKRVIVVLKNGARIADRFIEKKGSTIVLQGIGKVPAGDVSTLVIRKG